MKHLIMGTAGHVDHGKTALIKSLTNIDCDTHPEEKRRGITINLGFSYLKISEEETIGIIDVPGHKDFVNTMVNGACGIDFVLLVISADSGIMPQTIEHVNIISALGITKGIVALTKVDLVDDELTEMAILEIQEFLKTTPLRSSKIVPVSVITGNGIQELINTIKETIEQVNEKEIGHIFRMYIDRTFIVKGIGTVVTGTVLNGKLSTGEDVILLPHNTMHRARTMERHGHSVDSVQSGDRAAIQLVGIKKEEISKGALITNKVIPATKMIDASLILFETNSSNSHWSVVTFHSGTFETQARMHTITENESKNNIIAQLHFDKPGILLTNDKCIIRNSSGDKTLGGGIIIDAAPLHHKKRTTALVQSLKALTRSKSNLGSLMDAIHIELKKEVRPYTIEQISESLNISADNLNDILANKSNEIITYHIKQSILIIHNDYDTLFKNKVLEMIRLHHKEKDLSNLGLTTLELLGKLNLLKLICARDYLDSLLLKMKSESQIDNLNNTWVLKGHTQTIDNKSMEDILWIEQEFLKFDLQKPDFQEIENKALNKKIPKEKLKKYLQYLTSNGKLVFFNNEYIHSDVVQKYKSVLIATIENNELGIDMDVFRQNTGLSKRLVPILIAIYENQKIIFTKKTGIRIHIFLKK